MGIPGVTDHLMFGYACRIRRLTPDEQEFWKLDLGESELRNCVAVYGEDLGECLAAVVDIKLGRLVWSDADADGTPVPEDKAQVFADAVVVFLHALFPHLKEV